MKLQFLLGLFLLLAYPSLSQTRYAYLPEGKTSFQTSTEKIIVGFREGHFLSKMLSARLTKAVLDTENIHQIGTRKWNVFTLSSDFINIDSVNSILSDFRQDSNVAYANPFLIYKDNALQGLTDQVLVKVKESTSQSSLSEMYESLGVYKIEMNPYIKDEYTLTIHPTEKRDALDVADTLYETGLFDYCEPDFIHLNGFTTNDPLFSDQWNLQNTQQYGGTSGADIKAVAAWCVSTGTGIRVAVIDEGVDLNHPDLQGNLLPGIDELGQGTNGAPIGDNPHGTAVAGIIAAVANNNIGITGIANTCKIIPVRVGTELSWSISACASGISWAASPSGGNADIINNSWSGGSSSSALNSAIANAISSGRGGKGCVVLFASGNDGNSAISYPANQPNVIAVGASNMCDQRVTLSPTPAPGSCNYDTRLKTFSLSGGSNYGTGLAVVAPGINIATLDISGQPGYSDINNQGWIMGPPDYLNYVLNFDGTSAACPHAAAVAALILSINPSLTYKNVTNIIEATADKVGGYGYSTYYPNGSWDPEMGFGRINATSAVNQAASTIGISGSNYICHGSSVYSVAAPSAVNVTWSVSNSDATLSCTTCSQTTLTMVSSGSVNLTATGASSCSAIPTAITWTKNVYLGSNPDINISSTPGSCSGSTQEWLLTAEPSSDGSNYNWQVSYTSPNSNIYINNPSAFSTYVDVTGGGGLTLSYTDLCGVKEQNGTTIYSSCGTGAAAFTLTPNPASNTVLINSTEMDTKSNIATIQAIRLFDLSGKLRKSIQYPMPVSQATFGVSDLSPGMYFVQVFNGRSWTSEKLIVQSKN